MSPKEEATRGYCKVYTKLTSADSLMLSLTIVGCGHPSFLPGGYSLSPCWQSPGSQASKQHGWQHGLGEGTIESWLKWHCSCVAVLTVIQEERLIEPRLNS